MTCLPETTPNGQSEIENPAQGPEAVQPASSPQNGATAEAPADQPAPCNLQPSTFAACIPSSPQNGSTAEAPPDLSRQSEAPADQLAPCNLQPSTSERHSQRGRNGLIARLPKAARDQINGMMLDAVPYREIRQRLGEQGKALTDNCFCSWKTGGHQDFLKELRLLDEYRVRHELTLDLAREDQGIDVFQGAHKIAASLICEAVAEMGADTLRQALNANPLNLLRMLNSLSRLTAGGLKCQRALGDEAERVARVRQQQKPKSKKGLSKQALKEMNDKLRLM